MEVCKKTLLGFENRFYVRFSIFPAARAQFAKNKSRLAKASFFLHTSILPYLPRIPWPPAKWQKLQYILYILYPDLTQYNKLTKFFRKTHLHTFLQYIPFKNYTLTSYRSFFRKHTYILSYFPTLRVLRGLRKNGQNLQGFL
jgi:hypothetical protein